MLQQERSPIRGGILADDCGLGKTHYYAGLYLQGELSALGRKVLQAHPDSCPRRCGEYLGHAADGELSPCDAILCFSWVPIPDQ